MAHRTLAEAQADWRETGLWRDATLFGAMQDALARHPDARAVFHSPESGVATHTLRDVHARAERLAAGLYAAGLRPADVIAVQLPNSLENAALHIAAARLGCIILPIIHIFGPRELNFILADSGATTLVASTLWQKGDAEAKLSALDAPALERLILIGGTIEARASISFAGLMACAEAAPGPARVSHNDIALMLYTSGTTSTPKGVRHSHNSLLAEFNAQAMGFDAQGAGSLSPWPSGHIAGTIGLLSHSVLGRDAVIMQQWDPLAAARLIADYGVQQTSGTPLHLMGILDAASQHDLDLSSLKRFIIGATTVPETIVAKAEAAGVRAVRCYGSTELPTSTQCLETDPLDKRLNTDGRPLPGCEVRIVDDELCDLPIGAEGEILVRGAECARGYTDPARTAEAFMPDGWFRTGDIGRLDKAGFMTVTDRKKDIIIRGGENISSLEVEDLMLKMPEVREVAAVAAPDERLGEIVCAFVVTQSGADIDIPAIDEHFRALGVARQKTPERLERVGELPRTPTGKVLKTALRARLK